MTHDLDRRLDSADIADKLREMGFLGEYRKVNSVMAMPSDDVHQESQHSRHISLYCTPTEPDSDVLSADGKMADQVLQVQTVVLSDYLFSDKNESDRETDCTSNHGGAPLSTCSSSDKPDTTSKNTASVGSSTSTSSSDTYTTATSSSTTYKTNHLDCADSTTSPVTLDKALQSAAFRSLMQNLIHALEEIDGEQSKKDLHNDCAVPQSNDNFNSTVILVLLCAILALIWIFITPKDHKVHM